MSVVPCMHRRMGVGLVALALAAAAGALARADAPKDAGAGPAKGRCVVTGLVLRGAKPSAATVEVRWATIDHRMGVHDRNRSLHDVERRTQVVVWRGEAGADGRFAAVDLPAGGYRVAATAADGAGGETLALAPIDGAHDEVVLTLLRGTETLRGIVIHADGRPFPLRVHAGAQAVDAAPDGTFEIAGLRPGRVEVRTEDPNGGSTVETVTLPSSVPLVLRVRDADGWLRLRVLAAPGGQAVGGAAISFAWEAGPKLATDAEGRARVPYRNGRWVDVQAPGFARGSLYLDGRVSRADAEIRLKQAAVISGRVRRASDGTPVAGVVVEASKGDWRVPHPDARTTSGAEGLYVLDGLQPGPTTVIARGAGLVVSGLESLPADDVRSSRRDRLEFDPLLVEAEAGKTTLLDLDLVPGATLRGRVADARGNPVVGAVVEALCPRASYLSSTPPPVYWERAVTTTDLEGRYEIASLIPGRRYDVVTDDPSHGGGLAVGHVLLPADGALTELDLTLPRAFSFDVRVIDAATGEGIPGIGVGGRADRGAAVDTETGEDGWARLFATRAGVYDVVARRDRRYAPLRPGGDVEAKARVDLTRGPPVEPVVLRLAALPAAGSAPKGDGWKDEARRLAERVAKEQSAAEKGPDPLRADPTPKVVFLVRVLGPDGSAVPNAEVRWRDGGSPRRVGGSAEVHAGDARLEVDASVRARLQIEIRGATDAAGSPLPVAPFSAGPFDVASGKAEVRLELEKTIEGIVVGPDGKGVRGIRVLVSEGRNRTEERGGPDAPLPEAYTDASGSFRVRGLRSALYLLSFYVPSPFAPVLPRTALAGGHRLEFRLRAADEIRVRVVDPAKRPVAGAWVVVEDVTHGYGNDLPQDMWRGPEFRGTTDEDGVVRLRGLSRDLRVRLRMGPPDSRKDLEQVVIRAWTPVDGDVALGGLSVVRGVVRDPSGAPLPGLRVLLLRGNTWEPKTESLPDGTFSIPVPTAGEWVISADSLHDDARISSNVATVHAGDEGVVLVIHRGWELVVRVDPPGAPLGSTEWWGPEAWLLRESSEDSRSSWAGQSKPGKDGAFRFHDFHQQRADETYSFWIPPDRTGAYVLAQGLHAAVGGAEVPVRARKGRPTSGRLTGPKRVGDATTWASQGPLKVWTRSEPDGTFRFPGLPGGVWTVHAQATSEGQEWTGDVDVTAGSDVVLPLTIFKR